MDRWIGKVAIVTGASSGIGASVCESLACAGIQVVGMARRLGLIEELAKKVNAKAVKGKLTPYKVDMTNEDEIVKAFEWVTKNVGPVHILVNNAGVLPTTDLLNGDAAKWKLVYDTNVIGLCIASREAAKVMMARKINGHIVNVNSIFGHIPTYAPGMNVYPSSKHAVRNLTEQFRQELRLAETKIKVSNVSPGHVDTNIVSDGPLSELLKQCPSLSPEDVANAVLYMLGTPEHVQVHDLIIKPIGEFC